MYLLFIIYLLFNLFTMLTRIYDSYLEVVIIMNDSTTYRYIFDSSWKVKDALSWMYDTYCIDDDKIVEQTCSFVKRYKLKSNG